MNQMKKLIKTFLVSIAKKNVFLRELMYNVKLKLDMSSYMKFYKKYDVDEKLCVFEAFNGRKYGDSPKAVYLEMLNNEKYRDFRFVWALKNVDGYDSLKSNERTQIVKYNSDEYKKVYASAKYWFTPSRLPDYIIPKDEQVYVQFWHGTPLKRLGYDIEVKGKNALNTIKEWSRKYEYDASRYSYMVSPSAFTTDKYISAFNLKKLNKDKCILETGYPRNDALYTYSEEDIRKIKDTYSIPKDKKIILYAPTWRDNQHQAGLGYTYKAEVDFDKLRQELGDDFIILFRAHYLVANSFDFNKYEGFVYNVSDVDDINELYIISDLLITDYSSVFFDYANLRRTIIFYMYDYDEYADEIRGFYIDMDELPGKITKNEDELLAAIHEAQENDFIGNYDEFNDKFNYLDDAGSAGRVVEKVIEIN